MINIASHLPTPNLGGEHVFPTLKRKTI